MTLPTGISWLGTQWFESNTWVLDGVVVREPIII
jgi:hypothetical protein